LVDLLRETLGLTGTHIGCDTSYCGACTVRVNGEIVRACLMLAVQADGGAVQTIEGLSDSGEVADLQDAFRDRNALQCGYCTPGMLMTGYAFLGTHATPTEDEIRVAISGNLCRCTGYVNIVKAVQHAAAALAQGGK